MPAGGHFGHRLRGGVTRPRGHAGGIRLCAINAAAVDPPAGDTLSLVRQRASSPSDEQLSLSQAAILQPPITVHAGAPSAACCARCSRLGRGAGAAALPQRAGAAAVLPQRRRSGTVCRSSSAAVCWSGRRTAARQQRRRLERGGVGRAAAAHPAHPAPELEGRKRAGALSQVAGGTLA